MPRKGQKIRAQRLDIAWNSADGLDCVDVQAPPDAKAMFPYLTTAWAHRWPSEEIWRVRKAGPAAQR